MPIWKAPLIVAGAKKAAAAAAPLVTRAAQTLARKVTPPVVTPRAAQAARTVDQIVSKAKPPVVTPKATQPLVRAAQQATKPPLVTPRTIPQATAPIIRAAGTAARAIPAVAVGYGLARTTQPQTPPLVTPQAQTPPLVTPRGQVTPGGPPLVKPRVAAPVTVATVAAPVVQTGTGYVPYTPRDIAPLTLGGGTGYEYEYEPFEELPPAEVGQPGAGELPPAIVTQHNDLLTHIDQVANQNVGLAAMHTSQLMAAIDATEARIMEMFRQQGTALDPATLSALRSLRDGVETRRRQLTDEMNRRGLLQSGIWLEMEDRIHRGQLTAEEDLLGRRLSDIQNRMSGAMMDFAQQRLNVMGTGLREQRDIMRDAGQQGITARQNFIDQQFDWTRWQQEQAARAAQWDRAYQQEERAAAEARRRWEAEQADEAARFAEDTRRWGQEHALRLRDQRLQERAAVQTGAQTRQPTLTERDRAAFAEAYSAVVTAVNAGTPPEVIKNNIRARAADLIRDGIDVNQLLQQVDTLYLQRLQAQPPAGQQNQVNWYTGLDQSLGGLLPWGASRR